MRRREWLRVGGLSAFGLSLGNLMAARSCAADSRLQSSFGRAKSCIVLFMLGGPPQHETWDPKPLAPIEIRGPLGTIATATPGLRVGEIHAAYSQANRSHGGVASHVDERQCAFIEWLLDADRASSCSN